MKQSLNDKDTNYTLTNISLVLKLSPHANEKSRGKGRTWSNLSCEKRHRYRELDYMWEATQLHTHTHMYVHTHLTDNSDLMDDSIDIKTSNELVRGVQVESLHISTA